jgi:hypothetical protein
MGADWSKFDAWCNNSDYSSDFKIIFNFVQNINMIDSPIIYYDYLSFCHNFAKAFFDNRNNVLLSQEVHHLLNVPNKTFTKLLPEVITYFRKVYKPWIKNNETINSDSSDWNIFIKEIQNNL